MRVQVLIQKGEIVQQRESSYRAGDQQDRKQKRRPSVLISAPGGREIPGRKQTHGDGDKRLECRQHQS
jgi:hypothetical protein